ncbi:MAG: L,D-transpeptidase, partial [Dokdonella sp.]
MPRLLIAACFVLFHSLVHASPFWGARNSMPVDTPPADLKPGEWIWGGDDRTAGPMAVIVSVSEQRAYAYRNGILIAVSTVSTGKPGYETPSGVFTILQKDKDHHSNKYNSAPMPYQQRLTWDGIALHAGGLPGYPESHGCVHLPTQFATLLFAATNMGMTVVISKEGASPPSVVHPRAISPIEPHTGAAVAYMPLAEHEDFRWNTENVPDGPISILLSRSDRRVVVYRGGIEIGRARVVLNSDMVTGVHAYIVAKGFMSNDVPALPGLRMPKWITIGIPGRADEAGRELDADTIASVSIPPAFAEQVYPLLKPGVVLLATDAHINP